MSEARFEAWIDDSPNAPAALVLREFLVPVEGNDGVFFPPTFAASENPRSFLAATTSTTWAKGRMSA